MQHHWDAYGYWADALSDYVDMDIMSWLHTPQFRDMIRHQQEWACGVPCYPGIGLSVWPEPR